MKKFYIGKKDVKKAFAGKQKVKKIFSGKTLVWQDAPDEVPHFSFIAALPGTSVSLSKEDGTYTPAPSVQLMFSTVRNGDQSEWLLWDKSAVQLDVGDELQLRATPSGNDAFACKDNGSDQYISYNYFVIDGKSHVSGDLGALLDENGQMTSLSDHECAFAYLFRMCTGLLNAPDTYFTLLSPHSYDSMFFGCSSIVSANDIPADSTKDWCFKNMFTGCTSLQKAPEIKTCDTSIGSHYEMYYGCLSLTCTPHLPVDASSIDCCNGMFSNCTSLVSSDTLNSHVVGDGAYNNMFSGCISLKHPPKIKATQLLETSEYVHTGYNMFNMFSGCSSIESMPALEYKTISRYGNYGLFGNSSSLSNIVVKFKDWPSEEYATGWWVRNVSPTGIFTCPEELPEIYDIDHIPVGWEVRKYKEYEGLRFTAAEDNSTVLLSAIGSPDPVSLSVSYDYGITWQEWDMSEIKLRYEGDYVCLKGNNQSFSLHNSYYQFVMSGKIAASGNIMSLLDETMQLTSLANQKLWYCFLHLFSDCTALSEAPSLPAMNVGYDTYASMFSGCTGLIRAPEISATNTSYGCFSYMFSGCSSMTTPPPALFALNNDILSYSSMFNGCTSLSSSPNIYATEISEKNGCAGMFTGCTSLSRIKVNFTKWKTEGTATNNWVADVAPTGTFICPSELPTEFGTNRIPEGWTVNKILPEDILTFTADGTDSTIQLKKNGNPDPVSLEYFDGDWHDYTIDSTISIPTGSSILMRAKNATNPAFAKAPEVPNDANINEVDENGQLTYSDSNYYQFVMTGKIAASGNILYLIAHDGSSDSVPAYGFHRLFKKCKSLTTAPQLPASSVNRSSYAYMFHDCTSLSNAPELPAMQLSGYCYQGMFQNCTSLTSAPRLLATLLTTACYSGMFQDCTSLSAIPELPATELTSYCYNWMFYGCNSLSSINVNFTTWDPYSATDNWVHTVASSGTFVCPVALPEQYGNYNIPTGWTVVRK